MTKEELQKKIGEAEVRAEKKRYGCELRQAVLEYAAPLLARGMSQTQVAGDLGIKAWTLRRWHQNAGKRAGAPRKKEALPEAMSFVRLEAAKPEPRVSVEVVLGNGRMVRAPTGFDSATLERVLAIAEQGCSAMALADGGVA